MQYRPEIDGLRAIAVLGVVFYHLDSNILMGGWLGVDIFFVISGYLISSGLLEELNQTGTISISQFYLRRVRRIAPALLACLIGTAFLALPLSGTAFFSQYLQSAIAALFSVSNIFFWKEAGYFALDSQFVFLLHTWTLGVEEQFYIIIPAFFLLLARMSPNGRKKVWITFAFTVFFSFLFCRYGREYVSEPFLFYMLPTRMWELGIGTLISLYDLQSKQRLQLKPVRTAIGVSCLLFYIYLFTYSEGNSYFAEKSLFVCLATALFILFVRQNSIIGHIVSLSPIRFIGKISYSIYLWHWPIIVFWNILVFKYDLVTDFWVQLTILLTTILIAMASWKYIETPVRREKTWQPCITALAPYVGMFILLLALGFVSLNFSTNKITLDTSSYPEPTYDDIVNNKYLQLGEIGEPSFLVIGDSHAHAILYSFDTLAHEYKISGIYSTHPGTPPLPTIRHLPRLNDPPFAQEWIKYANDKDIKNIILVARWNLYYTPNARRIDTGTQCTPQELLSKIIAVIKCLIDNGHDVWFVNDVPEFKRDPVLASRVIGPDYSEQIYRKYIENNINTQKISNVHFHIIDPWPFLLSGNRVYASKNNALLYSDTSHLTQQGADLIKDAFRPIFEQIKTDYATIHKQQ